MINSLNPLLPWICGALIGYRLGTLFTGINGIQLASAGIGGFSGYLALSFVIWCADQFSLSILVPEFLSVLQVITVLLIVSSTPALLAHTILHDSHLWSTKSASFTALVLTFSFITLAAFWTILNQIPIFGWDVLDHWATEAARFLNHTSHPAPDEQPFVIGYIHPPTIALVLSWTAWASGAETYTIPLISPWLSMHLSAAMICFGTTMALIRTKTLASVVTLVCVTAPLHENHALIMGYPEIALSVCVLGSVALITIGLHNQNKLIVIVGVGFGFTSLSFKSTGIIYALVPLLSLIIAVCVTRLTNYWVTVTSAGLALILSILGIHGFSISGYPIISA